VAFLEDAADLWLRLPAIKDWAREKKIAVEVTEITEALAAARAGADMVQVDKLSPTELRPLVQALREDAPTVLIAAAGGINEQNASAYAATGVDLLVTSAVYWGKPADISVTMTAAR
jgi:molybdenum transport protein